VSHTLSVVKICNMALSHIGANSSIESLSEASAEAQACDIWYDFSRTQTLEANNWNFARKRLTLVTHADDPPSGVWAYRYQYPSDCVMIRRLQNPSGDVADITPFEIEMDDSNTGKTILTDLDEAVAVYTFDQEDTNVFSPFFVEMLSLALATHIVFTLTGKGDLKNNLTDNFINMSRVAPSLNANEEKSPAPRDAPWIRGRQ